MKTAYSVTGLQVESLLKDLANDRDRQIEGIVRAADARASELLASARASSRRRLKETVRQERSRLERRMRREQAGLATAAREHRLKIQRERLERGRALATAALEERWRETAGRRAWIEMAIEVARVLEPGPWKVGYAAAGPTPDELESLDQNLSRLCGEAPELSADPALTAGLVIRTNDVILDLSSAGLLRDQGRIDGLLLATLLEQESEGNEER